MTAVLVDTSVWVEFLRGTDSAATHQLRHTLDQDPTSVVICEPVAMELLAGASDEAMLLRLERLVNGLPGLALDPSVDFRAAAAIFRGCRRAGWTIRGLSDCLIAAIAVRHGVELMHQDRDYDAIGHVTALRARSLH